MQGRPGQDRQRAWDDKQTEARLAALREATSKHRAVSTTPPQRPPNMTRLDAPPETPRVPRPQRENRPRRMSRRGTLIIVASLAILAIIAGAVGTLLASGIAESGGAAGTAVSFLSGLSTQNYKQAYQNLGPSITLRLSEDSFTTQITSLDQRYGKITEYTEDKGSALNDNGKQSYTYTIKREKYNKEYKLRLTLQDVQNEGWRIISYGTSLGPTQ
jgi:hypothetical protein